MIFAGRCCCDRPQLRAHALKVEKMIDASPKVIGGDTIIEPELEELRRLDLHPHPVLDPSN